MFQPGKAPAVTIHSTVAPRDNDHDAVVSGNGDPR